MAALTAARLTKSRGDGRKREWPMAASTTIYAGGLVMLNSAGYVQPASSDLASPRGVVGVATQTVTNSGSAGASDVEVEDKKDFLVAGTTLTVAGNGGMCWAEDDQTVDETAGSNEPIAGTIVEFVSASSAWVHIDADNNLVAEYAN